MRPMVSLHNDSGSCSEASSCGNNTGSDTCSLSSGSSSDQLASSDVSQEAAVATTAPHSLRKYEESAVLEGVPKNISDRKVSFAPTHIVTEISSLGEQKSYSKQHSRSVHNPWRRFGPEKQIYKLGGWKVISGKKKPPEYKRIEPNTVLPTAPPLKSPFFSLFADKNHQQCNLNLELPEGCRTVEEAAHLLAVELATHLEDRYINRETRSKIKENADEQDSSASNSTSSSSSSSSSESDQ